MVQKKKAKKKVNYERILALVLVLAMIGSFIASLFMMY